MTSIQKSKSNFLLAMSLFGVFAVGGAAVMLSNNTAINRKIGASNVDQNLSDVLVKRGTSSFSPCKDLDVKYTYALLGNGVKVEKGTPAPKRTGKPAVKPTNTPDNMPNSCTPLVATSAMAEAFVGKRVSVTGTFTGGVFYATKIVDANMPNENSLKTVAPKASGKPSNPPKMTTKPIKGNPPVDPIYPIDPQN